jgi:hypothetical protein
MPERMLLMRLSVFHGGWTLEQATEVCAFDGLDEYEVLDGLGQLVQKSLIFTVSSVDGENRYRRLETIRQYAREKLLDSGASEAVYDRHLEAFLTWPWPLSRICAPTDRSNGWIAWSWSWITCALPWNGPWKGMPKKGCAWRPPCTGSGISAATAWRARGGWPG